MTKYNTHPEFKKPKLNLASVSWEIAHKIIKYKFPLTIISF